MENWFEWIPAFAGMTEPAFAGMTEVRPGMTEEGMLCLVTSLSI